MLLLIRAGFFLSRTQQRQSRHSLRPQMMTRLQHHLERVITIKLGRRDHLVITCTNKTKYIIKSTYPHIFEVRSLGAGLFSLPSHTASQPRKEISYRVLTPGTIAEVYVEFLYC